VKDRLGRISLATQADVVQVELKKKYKYRLILDESQSFGMIGTHGRGITEYYGVPVSEGFL